MVAPINLCQQCCHKSRTGNSFCEFYGAYLVFSILHSNNAFSLLYNYGVNVLSVVWHRNYRCFTSSLTVQISKQRLLTVKYQTIPSILNFATKRTSNKLKSPFKVLYFTAKSKPNQPYISTVTLSSFQISSTYS